MSTQPRERSTAPRYLKINGQWYVSKQHMAEQMETAIISALSEGFRQASSVTYIPRLYAPLKAVDLKPGAVNRVEPEEIVAQ